MAAGFTYCLFGRHHFKSSTIKALRFRKTICGKLRWTYRQEMILEAFIRGSVFYQPCTNVKSEMTNFALSGKREPQRLIFCFKFIAEFQI